MVMQNAASKTSKKQIAGIKYTVHTTDDPRVSECFRTVYVTSRECVNAHGARYTEFVRLARDQFDTDTWRVDRMTTIFRAYEAITPEQFATLRDAGKFAASYLAE